MLHCFGDCAIWLAEVWHALGHWKCGNAKALWRFQCVSAGTTSPVIWESSSDILRRCLSWRRCFGGFLLTYRFSLPLCLSPTPSPGLDTQTDAHLKPDSRLTLGFFWTLQWISHPCCPSSNASTDTFFSSFSPSSTVFCRVSALLATLRQPLVLIRVRTRLPSLPLRAPTATAHASIHPSI